MRTIRLRKNNLLIFWTAACSIALLSSVCVAKDIKKDNLVADSTEKSERECRTYSTVGSKMRRSKCMSKKEWAVVDAREKELDEEQGRNIENAFRKIRQRGGLSINGDGLDNPNAP